MIYVSTLRIKDKRKKMAEPTEEERKKYGIELSSTGGGIRKSKLKSLIHIHI